MSDLPAMLSAVVPGQRTHIARALDLHVVLSLRPQFFTKSSVDESKSSQASRGGAF